MTRFATQTAALVAAVLLALGSFSAVVNVPAAQVADITAPLLA